ncbi:hypothetical protein PAXINDRAFT_101059 [Paxillus involutus ATCC 200175]|uniref:Uncharacterized protein n=1 Tax=Paxillus involutus ATCC 200175 TaxID=664439 RepID=A0A0C9SUN0_PAXIN|nr:hypothetical protein PAXINDRAFT_101059 [Paxillus involutus ATCC 200175]
MFRAAFRCCIVTFLAQHIQATQVPLEYSRSDWRPPAVADHGLANWNMDDLPNPNATSHLVFETVNSLLQRWPNTRMRNGHTIVPGTIPKGTLLYHGTSRNELPPGPDWTATDPEHSLIFCRGEAEEGCWHLTLATTRPLKVVYFDGSSAAKFQYGSMDTQDLIAWGTSRPRWIFEEIQRIQDLCKWGQSYGVDGFVRMEVDFEFMLCNFTSGVRVVSFLNLPSVRPPRNRQSLLDPLMTVASGSVDVAYAGSWHNHFPGEIRVQLDLAGLVSFYDTQLVPSLVPIRMGQERWDHRVQNTSSEDILAVKARLAEALTRPEGFSTGIDWMTLVRVIVDRYAGRLELIQYLLITPATDSETVLDLARKIQVQLRVMLTPYILHSAVPLIEIEFDWAVPVFKLCATTHTSSIQFDSPSMTPSEHLILQAVRDTTREICRVVTKMWASGVHVGIDERLNPKELPDAGEVTNLMNAWRDDVDRLMGWLDWNVWVKCKPACGPEEMCYLPTWPIGFPWPDWDRRGRRPGNAESSSGTFTGAHENSRTLAMKSTAAIPVGGWSDMMPGPDAWIRPQPRCIRRVEPYEF